jgi:hypothetical protein
MTRISRLTVPLTLTLTLFLGSGALAQDEWKFGIGTGISSFSLDGDIGFPTPGGGVVFDVDLSNSDTRDLVESGLGLGGYVAKGKWKVLYSVARVTLEDSDGGLTAEWDRTQAEVAGVYNFAKTGKHAWGVLFGARLTDHDWEFMTENGTVNLTESWTDALVGITHAVPFAEKWSWANRFDAGFGQSEGSLLVNTTINRLFGQHWLVHLGFTFKSVEFGEEGEIANSDFYLYDVKEPAFGLGFLYIW